MSHTSRVAMFFLCLALTNPASASITGCEKPQVVSRGSTQCRIYAEWVLAVGAQGVFAQKRAVGTKPEDLCDRKPGVAPIQPPNQTFACFYRGLALFTDSESAPGTESFSVVDAGTGQLKFKDGDQDEPIQLVDGTLRYFSFSKKLAESACPKGATVGFGCTVIEKVSLDLKTFKKTPLGETKTTPIQ